MERRNNEWQRLGLLALMAMALLAGVLIVRSPQAAAVLVGLVAATGYALLVVAQPFPAFCILTLFALTVWLSGIRALGDISAMIGLGAIFTLSWFARLILRLETFTRVREYRLLLALLVVLGASTLVHLDGLAGFSPVLTYLQLLLLFVLVVNLVTTPARLAAVGHMIIFSSASLAVLILLDQIGWLPPQLIPEQNVSIAVGMQIAVSRSAGLWGDANVTALQLTIALPFIMASWPKASRPVQALFLAAGAAIVAAFVWTFSMGGLLGLSVMLLIKMLMAPQRHRLFIITRNGLLGLIALSAFITFAPDLFVQRVVILFESNVGAFITFDQASLLTVGTLRGDTWWAALKAIAAAPLLGYGPGNGMYATASYSILRSAIILSPHNMFLALAGDLGLIGLAFFVALFVSAWQAVRPRSAARVVEPGLRRTREALFIALIGYAVQGMALEVHNMKLLWILLGMAIVCRELSTRSTAEQMEAAR